MATSTQAPPGEIANVKFVKRRPLDDVPGLKLDVELNGRRAIIKIEACGHTLVFDDLTRENDIDRDSEKWEVTLDGKLIARMWPHPDNAWSKTVCPLGRDKIQEARGWIWMIARAHKVNAENILEIRDHQFPESCVARLVHNEYIDPVEKPAAYFRRALRHVWEI